MADLLDSIKHDIDKRLTDLRPLVEEAHQLEQVLQALDGQGGSRARRRSRGRRPSPRRKVTKRSRATKAEMEERRKRILALVGQNPGIKASNLAMLMEVTPTTMARLLKKLEVERAARRKKDGGWVLRPAPGQKAAKEKQDQPDRAAG